jgi:hypothetical protein
MSVDARFFAFALKSAPELGFLAASLPSPFTSIDSAIMATWHIHPLLASIYAGLVVYGGR